jgi:hypothetical protein
MPITVVDVPAPTDQGLDVPQLTDPEAAWALSVLDEATKATEVVARTRRDSSHADLGTAGRQDNLLTPGQAQPWDY